MANEDPEKRAARLVTLHGKEAAMHAVERMRRHALAGDRRQAHLWGTVLSHVRRLLAAGADKESAGTDPGMGAACPARSPSPQGEPSSTMNVGATRR